MADYTLSDVQAMTAGDGGKTYSLSDVRAMAQPEKVNPKMQVFNDSMQTLSGGVPGMIMRLAMKPTTEEGRDELKNAAMGGVSGTTDIGNTLLGAGSWLVDKLAGTNLRESNKSRAESLKQYFRENADPESAAFTGGRMASNVAGTLGVGSAVALPLRAVGSASPVISGLANAIESGGMVGNKAIGPLANLGVRAAGGAINGGLSSALVDPESAGTGALIGGGIPVVGQVVGSGVSTLANAARKVRTPTEARMAADIAEMAGAKTPGEIAAVRDALRQQGPNIIQGPGATVPQILQTPELSQLQRTVKAVTPTAFSAQEAAANAARLEALNRIAPVNGTVQQAAEEAGNSIANFAGPARQSEGQRVNRLFDAVDPFNETRIQLPIDEMRAARDKFLGPGTFGSGNNARNAIETAERIGTETLPAIQPVRVGRDPQSLLQAVRAAGGINQRSAASLSGELSDVGQKQLGTTGLLNRNGKNLDRMAEIMHERGFIPDSDPATLLYAMRNGGSGRYGADIGDNAFAGQLERSMGDAPGATQIAKPVTFQEIQNLRSSIGEAAQAASAKGYAREAAALQEMKHQIDARVQMVSAGMGKPGEFFPADVTSAWKEALAAHQAKKLQFDTGPQKSLSMMGADGLPRLQGAEIPGKFFNAARSQVADAQAFRRLVKNDPNLIADLKRYAITDAAGQVDRFGNLTNAKFNKWLDARSGATGVLFNAQDRAALKAVADDVRRADLAESLGRATGSDTMQKASNMLKLGVLDSPGSAYVAGKIPGGRMALDFLRGNARSSKAERLAGLLVDPQRTSGLLDVYLSKQAPSAVPRGLLSLDDPAMLRTVPVLLAPNSAP